MRSFFFSILTVLALLLPFPSGSSSAQTAPRDAQILFLGDRSCGPRSGDCVFPAVVTTHRYLHVILHDQPQNDNWRVYEGPSCFITMHMLMGDRPTGGDGYLEIVADLSLLGRDGTVGPLCFLFKAANAESMTYYGAYFDDSSTEDAPTIFPGYKTLAGRPDLPDLDIAYIHRSPTFAYDAAQNGPVAGQLVHFTATVDNAGGVPTPPFSYVWDLDGRELLAGTFEDAIPAGKSAELDLPLHWNPRPHQLRLMLLPGGAEISNTNDTLTVRTDALSLGFWVEEGARAMFDRQQWSYCRALSCEGSDSFADWLQRQISAWNAVLGASRDPLLAPSGVADRVRVDEITVVPNGALPLHGGLPTNDPDFQDHSVDLEWGLPALGTNTEFPSAIEGTSDVDWGLLHELGHARSLTDLYRFDITAKTENAIQVHGRDGRLIFDPTHPADATSRLQVFQADQGGLFVHQNTEQDLMGCLCTPHYSSYNAVALNRLRGLRARCGNTNPPCNLGEWFTQMPAVNRLRVVDRNGIVVPDGTDVRVFTDTSNAYNTHAFDDTHVTSYSTAHGVVELGSDPFHTAGSTDQAAHKLLLIEVTTAADDYFCFAEPTQFNMAAWIGFADAAHPALYTLGVGRGARNDCNLALPPPRINEPFATAPYATRMTLGPGTGTGRALYRTLTIALRDDVYHPMRNRAVEIRRTSDQKVIAQGTTSAGGIVRMHVPAKLHSIEVVDLTDNNRVIPLGSAVARALAGRRP